MVKRDGLLLGNTNQFHKDTEATQETYPVLEEFYKDLPLRTESLKAGVSSTCFIHCGGTCHAFNYSAEKTETWKPLSLQNLCGLQSMLEASHGYINPLSKTK